MRNLQPDRAPLPAPLRRGELPRTPGSDRTRQELLAIVRDGLGAVPYSLPCKLFYDARGSQLFDQICDQPEYYLTRAETEILKTRGGEIAQALGPDVVLTELGSGSSSKTPLLIAAMDRLRSYVPIDISAEHLRQAARTLRTRFPGLPVNEIVADYGDGLPVDDIAAQLPRGRRVVFFSGSSIGNFEPRQATVLLRDMARLAGRDGQVLVAADLVKPRAILEAAYNDAAGITAEFNRNAIAHLQHELGLDIDPQAFAHQAVWQEKHQRIEMRLVVTRAQRFSAGGTTVHLVRGATIVTEHCHKYSVQSFAALAQAAGLQVDAVWTDKKKRFSLNLLRRTPSRTRAA